MNDEQTKLELLRNAIDEILLMMENKIRNKGVLTEDEKRLISSIPMLVSKDNLTKVRGRCFKILANIER